MTFSYANVNKELCIRIHIESMEEGANSLEFDIPYTHTPGSVSHTDGMFICDGIMVLGWGEDKEFWLHADISTAKVYNAPQKLDSVLRWNLPTYSITKGRQIYEKKVSGGLQGESRS